MLNYIKAELYRNFTRSYLWVYSGSIAVLALLLNILFKFGNGSSIDLGALFEITTQILIVPVFLVATIIDITTAEEQKNLTLKNAIAFGVPRSKIALSKVIVAIILSLITGIIIFIVFFGSGAILLGIKEGSLPIIKAASLKLLAAIPLWMGAVSVGIFIALYFNNSTTGAFVYAGTFIVLSNILKLLTMLVSNKFNYIYNILITTHLKELASPNLAAKDFIMAAGLGFAYTILFTIMSMLYIRKKEIK